MAEINNTHIRINVNRPAEIQAILDAVQKRSTVRLVSAADVVHLAKDAEERLDRLGTPKKYRTGATVEFKDGDLPTAYRYKAYSTYVKLERGTSSWFLIEARRVVVHSRQQILHKIIVPEVAKEPTLKDILQGTRIAFAGYAPH